VARREGYEPATDSRERERCVRNHTDDPTAEDTVDLAETCRAVTALEEAGVDALMLNGTSGEAFALTDTE
jgi:hypothetical protein